VDAHPDADLRFVRPWFGRQPPLGVDGRPDRVGRSLEDREKAVTLGLLFVAARTGDRGPDQLAVPAQQRAPAIAAQLPGESRRAFDVSEQEGDGADRFCPRRDRGRLFSDVAAPSQSGRARPGRE
jgi:hypothetical protein